MVVEERFGRWGRAEEGGFETRPLPLGITSANRVGLGLRVGPRFRGGGEKRSGSGVLRQAQDERGNGRRRDWRCGIRMVVSVGEILRRSAPQDDKWV